MLKYFVEIGFILIALGGYMLPRNMDYASIFIAAGGAFLAICQLPIFFRE